MGVIDKKIKSLFMLDPDVTYLNHGSFGACPEPIFNSLITWQRKLEYEPVKHLAHDIYNHLEDSRKALSEYINCYKDDVVFFPNPSSALNTVLRSLHLKKGDEILTTDHEYGAMDRAWRYISKKVGIKYINQPIQLPLQSKQEVVNQFVKGITKKTKIIFLSHISSPTAVIFPVKEICQIAKERNIITIVDGAHVPGHIPLDIQEIDPDFYTGACHKWMCSPKGVAFLYVKPIFQKIIEPLVISWGYEAEQPSHSQFLDYLQWQGTNDMSAYLTIPDTIKFLKDNNWKSVAKECRTLNLKAREMISEELKSDLICSQDFLGQMSTINLDFKDPIESQIEFYNKYKIQIPFLIWNNKKFIRLSIQVYNDENDINYLIGSLKDYLNR